MYSLTIRMKLFLKNNKMSEFWKGLVTTLMNNNIMFCPITH